MIPSDEDLGLIKGASAVEPAFTEEDLREVAEMAIEAMKKVALTFCRPLPTAEPILREFHEKREVRK